MSILLQQLLVDPPLNMGAGYAFSNADRREIDDQIRGCEQALISSLLKGVHATYFRLSGSSAGVMPGDNVCAASVNNSNEATVTKAVAADLANAGVSTGVVVTAASPGGFVLVAVGGMIGPLVTGLATGAQGPVRVNTTTGQCELCTAYSPFDYPVGTVDSAGWLVLAPSQQIDLPFVTLTAGATPEYVTLATLVPYQEIQVDAIVRVFYNGPGTDGAFVVGATHKLSGRFKTSSGGTVAVDVDNTATATGTSAAAAVATLEAFNGDTHGVRLKHVGIAATPLKWIRQVNLL
jgi:hypothetical protein